MREASWWVARCIFFDHRLPLASFIKVLVLRCFGMTIGSGVVIRSRVNISFPWKVTLGDHVWIGDDVVILSLAPVVIGTNVCISQKAFLCTGSHDFLSPKFDLITKPIVVEDHCWIGAMAFIAPGITFGSGSMCAAGSVVVKNVESGSLVAGNPAKIIRTSRDDVSVH